MWVCPTGERGGTDSVTQSLTRKVYPESHLGKFHLALEKSQMLHHLDLDTIPDTERKSGHVQMLAKQDPGLGQA